MVKIINMVDMNRIHGSDEIVMLLDKAYEQKAMNFKPRGLWYSIDFEWFEWCVGNMPNWIKRYMHTIELYESDILIISDIMELENFQRKYMERLLNSQFGIINWAEVTKKYKGIEIRNYYKLKELTDVGLDFMWLYGWDVSSGCIWDLSAIKSTQVEAVPNQFINQNIDDEY